MTEEFRPLQQFIAAHSQLALVTHRRPDADAVGSLLALGDYLSRQGKEVAFYCFDAIPYYLQFLPGVEKIRQKRDPFWQQAEAVVAIDCGDLSMTGLGRQDWEGKQITVIDHHISNPGEGGVNVIVPQAAACAEIIFNYFKSEAWAIDKNAATCLLAGIFGDTDGFSNLGTTPAALVAASELLRSGANFKEITANLLQNKSIAALKLWGRALERLRLDKEKGIAVTVIRESDLNECQARSEDMEGVANLLNHLADVKMAMVLREQGDGTVKGSLRTTSELLDVAKIAKLLGGGGHAKAAGFTVKGRIAETERGWKIVE